MNLLTSVALGWLGRRFSELGSLAAVIIPIYLAMPPEHQQAILAILTGQGGGLSISTAIGLVWYLWTQWQSYRATVKPQVVTPQGAKVDLDQLTPDAQHDVLVTASQAKPRRTIASAVLDGLIDKLNRNR